MGKYYRETTERYWTLNKLIDEDFVCNQKIHTGKNTNPATRVFYGDKKLKDYYCSDCVGFLADRYYTVVIPDMTPEEDRAREKYHIEAYDMAH